MEDKIVQRILNLAEIITESDTRRMFAAIRQCNTVDDIRYVFRCNNIRWADIVEEDATRLISGTEPLYFVSADAYVERYRRRRGIFHVDLRGQGAENVSSAVKRIRDQLNALKIQGETLDVTLCSYSQGFACLAEMQEFYASEEWQCKAKVARYLWNYNCRVCHRTDVKLHAHHESPIISAYHYSFRHNFSDNNLWVLCEDCHREFHAKTVRGAGRYYRFVDTQEVKAEKEYLKLLRTAHDQVKLCPYCYDYQPDWYERYAHWRPEIQP